MSGSEDQGFDTLEEAALSDWQPISRARAVEIRISGDDDVYVVVDTEPSHPMRVHCERINGRWHATSEITD